MLSDNVNKILVGNKVDMDESKRVVPTSKGQALADEYGIKFFKTSTKTNMNGELWYPSENAGKLPAIKHIQKKGHSVLIKEGIQRFDIMISKYELLPNSEHYAITVDLLGRMGELNTALDVINNMPIQARPCQGRDSDIGCLGDFYSHFTTVSGENYSGRHPASAVSRDCAVSFSLSREGSITHCAVSVKQRHETKFSHLDIAGRPVVVLEKNNVVPEHNVHFQTCQSPRLLHLIWQSSNGKRFKQLFIRSIISLAFA